MAVKKPTVYLETTIVSYLTARPSSNAVVLRHQKATRHWWAKRRHLYRVFVSPQVIEEVQRGDARQAKKRLRLLVPLEALSTGTGLETLAEAVKTALDIPHKARLDAFHVAYAIQNEIDYLLTWNCAHLANAPTLRRLADLCRREGLWLPIICTPDEMLREDEETP